MTFWHYLLLFSVVILSGAIAFLVRERGKSFLKIALSFSGAYILGITALHLMPSVFALHDHQPGLWILAGFFIQLFLEHLSMGVEHGHIHTTRKDGHRVVAFSIMLGLCLHAFLEGMPLGNYQDFHQIHHQGHVHGHEHLLYGIILHKAPAAFSLTAILIASGFSRRLSLIYLLVFAAMSPLGALTGTYFIQSANVQNIFLSMVIGSFLHIATTILFEADNSSHHTISYQKLFAILVGVGLAILTLFL
ncbi:MAG: ZIP family metal transporter [Phaeodactylibacter sp.]|nr:ZIP family metal transporter [Phaeodactylibacter sp.]